jgi:hypothetical protein
MKEGCSVSMCCRLRIQSRRQRSNDVVVAITQRHDAIDNGPTIHLRRTDRFDMLRCGSLPLTSSGSSSTSPPEPFSARTDGERTDHFEFESVCCVFSFLPVVFHGTAEPSANREPWHNRKRKTSHHHSKETYTQSAGHRQPSIDTQYIIHP